MDTIHIVGLSIKTKIGVHAWEQRIMQSLLIDLYLATDLSACTDDITKTIDYDALSQRVTAFVESKAFALIETVANEVATLIKQEFAVPSLRVTVHKPHAIRQANSVGVTVER